MRVYLSWIGSDKKKNRMTSGCLMIFIIVIYFSFEILTILKIFNYFLL